MIKFFQDFFHKVDLYGNIIVLVQYFCKKLISNRFERIFTIDTGITEYFGDDQL